MAVALKSTKSLASEALSKRRTRVVPPLIVYVCATALSPKSSVADPPSKVLA